MINHIIIIVIIIIITTTTTTILKIIATYHEMIKFALHHKN